MTPKRLLPSLVHSLSTLVALAAFSNAAFAQASVAGGISPPARADMALSGNVLSSNNVAGGHLACQSDCKRTPGCTGYSFDGAAKANCSLLSGTLTDTVVKGAVSCRMPCEPGPAISKALPARPMPGSLLGAPATLNATAAPAAAVAPAPVSGPPRQKLLGEVKAPPPPPSAPAGASAQKTAAPLSATPQRSAISGWELVTGAWVQIASASSATATAQCPGSKIALSAAYEAEPNQGDAAFGIEVRGAIPQGNYVRVFVRNANVFVAARVRATAVCVNAIPGLRVVDSASGVMNQNTNPSFYSDPGCAPTERLVGGGAMASIDVNVYANGPMTNSRGRSDGVTRWTLSSEFASPLAAAQNVSARALCAPEQLVDGWEYVEAPESSLGARSRTTVPIRCSTGDKRLLAAGFDATATASANFIAPVLQITLPDGSAGSGQLLNRNTIGGAASLRAKFGAICARG